MSWLSGGQSNQELVDNLYKNKLITSTFIRDAMHHVDRKKYLSLKRTFENAYEDMPLPLNDKVTISAPHMHAQALQYLSEQLQRPGCKCLDVGSGSGYLVACMLQCILQNVSSDGTPISSSTAVRVVGVEYLKDLVDHSQKVLDREYGPQVKDMCKIIHGDGWSGVPEYGPYDVIHVGAAALEIPQKLVDQLAPNGRMVIPVGSQFTSQYICLVDKDSQGKVTVEEEDEVSFVPLVNPNNEPYFEETRISSPSRGSSSSP
jgi:protein-L-isoaspartate(D-aspartate) O-methyltransferase